MKKLLILAYDFPPYVSVGGLRPYNWLKYLREFGVEPIVITRNWNVQYGNGLDYVTGSTSTELVTEVTEWGTILRTPYRPNWSNRTLLKHGEQKYRFARKARSGFSEYAQFLWLSGSKKELYRAADIYLASHTVDAIIATGDPYVLFHYARQLGKKYQLPWIADFRDPWSQDKRFQKNIFTKKWNAFLEYKTVKEAALIITVSPLNLLHNLFPNKDVFVLPNGFDPSVALTVQDVPQSTKILTFSFVGTVYGWHPWKSFIRVFSELLETEGVEMALHFYGVNIEKEILDFTADLPTKTKAAIHVFPRMPNADLLTCLAKENVMLLFNDYFVIGTKIYDYLAINRQILFCYANDVEALVLKEKHYHLEEKTNLNPQIDLLQETQAGVVAENALHLREILLDLLQEFKTSQAIACSSVGVSQFSRKHQVEKLADIVRAISE